MAVWCDVVLDDCLEDKSEDYQNCSVLYCVTQLCTVICTLIWAVLTDELFFDYFFSFFCVFTRASLFVWGLVILYFVYFFFLLFGCQCQCSWLPGKTCLWNYLLCVEWDVKPYTLTRYSVFCSCDSVRNSSHKYEGDFKNGHFDGFGVFTRSNGMKYEGEFKDGNITGFGRNCCLF